MNPLLRRSSSLALALLAVAALILSLLSTQAGAASKLADVTPEVGDCHRLDLDDQAAQSDGAKPVSCDRNHTARTFAVIDVPQGTEMDDLGALDALVSKKCLPLWRTTVGGSIATRILLAYSYVWFTPTQSQIDDGARFVRCDLILNGSKRPVALPDARTPQVGKRKPTNAESRCFTSRSTGYAVTSCAQKHAYRAKGTFKLKGKKFPTSAQFQRIANRQCPKIAGPKWLATPPSEAGFKDGFRLVICSKTTTR